MREWVGMEKGSGDLVSFGYGLWVMSYGLWMIRTEEVFWSCDLATWRIAAFRDSALTVWMQFLICNF